MAVFQYLEKHTNKQTIGDIADALGVSKTTVSRAISGKGRIGNETRKKILHYIEEHNYTPNKVAQGLASSKTYNIAWVVPKENNIADFSFFQNCLYGITEVAQQHNYDILICPIEEGRTASLERIVDNQKVDGVIFARSLVEHKEVELLLQKDIPFVVVGSSEDNRIVQIDNNHVNACRLLTEEIIKKGAERIGLIGGNQNHVVTRHRYQGYLEALERHNDVIREDMVYLEQSSTEEIKKAVKALIEQGADCIICMDDTICKTALRVLKEMRIRIPVDMKVASFFDSSLLEDNEPAISSVQVDAAALGREVCRVMIAYIGGEEVPDRTLLECSIQLRASSENGV